MSAKRIYISGPMTGYHDLNRAEFELAAKALREAGYDAVNPHDLNGPKVSWHEAMRVDIRAMLLCDGVATIHGWGKSNGAMIETKLAKDLAIEVRPIAGWIV